MRERDCWAVHSPSKRQRHCCDSELIAEKFQLRLVDLPIFSATYEMRGVGVGSRVAAQQSVAVPVWQAGFQQQAACKAHCGRQTVSIKASMM